MVKSCGLALALAAAAHAANVTPSAAPLRIAAPKCEFATNPLGIDAAQPRLFWQVASDTRGERQQAYEILAARSLAALARDHGDLWDSGKVTSDRTTFVRYAGQPLTSSEQVFWKVRAWDQAGRVSAWSAPQRWTMGLLQAADWKGAWIAAPAATETLLMRHDFTVRPGLRRAVAYVCGLGEYELFLNGGKVGRDLLEPGWTDFNKVTLYRTYDVTAQLHPGANAVGIALGNGMYNVVRRNRFSKFVGSFGPLRAIVQIRLEYADGSVAFAGTDEHWRTHAGPVTFASLYGGEDYDARLAPAGWANAGFDDRLWPHAVLINRPAYTLRGETYSSEPVRAFEARPPVSIRPLRPGVVLYDFGQNASFMPRIRVSGPAGSVIRLTPGEVVNPDGTIDRGTMGGSHRGTAYWQYTKATDHEETWFPQFYYVGSRYLYAELFPSDPALADSADENGTAAAGGTGAASAGLPHIDSIEQVLVHSTAAPVGTFATSKPLLNRIFNLVRWAQQSNMVSILTDCPHREKLGWLEQTHVDGPALRYDFDLARLFAKTSDAMANAQLPDGMVPNIAPEYTKFRGAYRSAAEWGAAFIMVPWQQYQFTGDTDLLRVRYDAMKRYVNYLASRAPDGVLSDGLGDWNDYVIGGKMRANLTPPPVTATAFYYEDAVTLSKIAAVLGHAADAKEFARRAAVIRTAYNHNFYHPDDAAIYGTGSETSLALPLALGIVDAANRAKVLDALLAETARRGYLTSGAPGTRFVMAALANNGHSDALYRLIDQDDKPGYGYILRQGATSMTETWNASRGASWDHFFLGQVVEWYYRDLAGIAPDPTDYGFKRIIIRPQPVGDLKWVEATYDSIHGPIHVRWDRTAGHFALHVDVPANTTATVYVPARAGTTVEESGAPVDQAPGVRFVRRDGDRNVYAVESGAYAFASTW